MVGRLLNEGEETSAQDALELLIEVAEAHPRFLRRHLTELASAMLQVRPLLSHAGAFGCQCHKRWSLLWQSRGA